MGFYILKLNCSRLIEKVTLCLIGIALTFLTGCVGKENVTKVISVTNNSDEGILIGVTVSEGTIERVYNEFLLPVDSTQMKDNGVVNTYVSGDGYVDTPRLRMSYGNPLIDSKSYDTLDSFVQYIYASYPYTEFVSFFVPPGKTREAIFVADPYVSLDRNMRYDVRINVIKGSTLESETKNHIISTQVSDSEYRGNLKDVFRYSSANILEEDESLRANLQFEESGELRIVP